MESKEEKKGRINNKNENAANYRINKTRSSPLIFKSIFNVFQVLLYFRVVSYSILVLYLITSCCSCIFATFCILATSHNASIVSLCILLYLIVVGYRIFLLLLYLTPFTCCIALYTVVLWLNISLAASCCCCIFAIFCISATSCNLSIVS